MPLISKEEYAKWTLEDKHNTTVGLWKDMLGKEENREYIRQHMLPYIEAGHKPSELVAVLCRRDEPFLPEVYRNRYPPTDKVVLEIAFRESIIKHAKEFIWDPSTPSAQNWSEQIKESDSVAPKPGDRIYLSAGLELEQLKLADNEFSVVIVSHGAMGVIPVKVPYAGETATSTELPIETVPSQIVAESIPSEAVTSAP